MVILDHCFGDITPFIGVILSSPHILLYFSLSLLERFYFGLGGSKSIIVIHEVVEVFSYIRDISLTCIFVGE
jgi:hypothetical protein